jgi:hypothetical protein
LQLIITIFIRRICKAAPCLGRQESLPHMSDHNDWVFSGLLGSTLIIVGMMIHDWRVLDGITG